MACFPGAMLASFFGWGVTRLALGGAPSIYGGGLLQCIVGVAPTVISSAVPAIIFVTTGVAISPSKGSSVAFVFFTLSLLVSAGGVEMIQVQDFSHQFWSAALVGQVVGGLSGLALALRLQDWRIKRQKPASRITKSAGTALAR
jgi:hypothetical protein